MKQIICLNGPPGVGKTSFGDEIFRMAARDYGRRVGRSKFAQPLDNIAMAMLACGPEEYAVLREQRKDEPLPHPFAGCTLRQLLINISEDLIKPTFGKQWFGLQAAKIAIDSPADMFIFCDSGFQYEFDAACATWQSLGYNVVVVNVAREGHTFEGDSREWVSHTQQVRVTNDADKAGLVPLAQTLLDLIHQGDKHASTN